ncbi:uncharacterized protein [Diadema antillarum]|uniref:uncharacterized protein n=1 Tax=Diadema antillarum TaxID=105358 RepID=UPI003A8C3943
MTRTVEGGVSRSTEEECDWVCEGDDQHDEDMIHSRYLVTAKNKKSLDKLPKKLEKNEECKDTAKVVRVTESLMFMAVVQMTTECAEEVREWGYEIERNSYHFTDAVNVEWHLDRIRNTGSPLLTPQIPFQINGNDGEGATIFVLDTGIYAEHEQFANTIVTHVQLPAESTLSGSNEGDPNGHGTQVASAAAGKDYGVAKKAELKSVRVANENGQAFTDDCIFGFDAVMASTPSDKCVVTFSLSGGQSVTLESAINELLDQTDCIVVVSAGNDNTDACSFTPARMSRVITVGASRIKDDVDRKAGFSNYGGCVDIYAPGHKMFLADKSGPTATVKTSGTSFSAPLVAGAAAVLLSNGVPRNDIKQTLLDLALANELVGLPSGSNNLLLNVADLPVVSRR